MNKIKRLVSLILVLSMLTTMFASCSKSNQKLEDVDIVKPIRASIEDSFISGDADPVINIKLSQTKANRALTSDMFELDGGFKDLIIIDCKKTRQGIQLQTQGNVGISASDYGVVRILPSATKSNLELDSEADVLTRDAYIDESSYVFTNDKVSFNIVLVNETFNSKQPNITFDEHELTVMNVSDDMTVASVEIAFEGDNIDASIDMLNGKHINLLADSLTSGNGQTMMLYFTPASFNAYVDYAKKIDDGYAVDLTLYAKYGTFSEITSEDLTFYDEFKDSKITNIVKEENGNYVVSLNILDDNASDEFDLTGEIALAPNKLTNEWGTQNKEEIIYDISYSTLADKNETLDKVWETITDFLEAHQDTFESISKVGSAISQVNGAVAFVTTILEWTGAIETTNDKVDKVYDAVLDVKKQISDVQSSIKDLDTKVDKHFQELLGETQKIIMLDSQTNWQAFVNNYVKPVDKTLSDYDYYFSSELSTYVNNVADYPVTIYIDSDGKVSYPDLTSKKGDVSFNGKDLTKEEIVLNAQQVEKMDSVIKAKKRKNGGRLYDKKTLLEDIKQVLIKDCGFEETKAQNYVDALKLHASIVALNAVGANNIVETYKNLCVALSGAGANLNLPFNIKPTDCMYNMFTSYYNFEFEAMPNLEIVNKYLSSILMNAKLMAVFAYVYDNNLKDSELDKYNDAANEQLKNMIVKHPDKTFEVGGINANKIWVDSHKQTMIYCYAVDKYVALMVSNYCNGASRSIGNEIKYYSYVDNTGLDRIRTRWSIMNKAGIDKSSDFYTYFTKCLENTQHQYKELLNSSKDYKTFVTGYEDNVPLSKLPTDNSLTLKVTSCWMGKHKNGSTVTFGKNGNIKPSKFVEKYSHVRKITYTTLNSNEQYSEYVGPALYQDYWESEKFGCEFVTKYPNDMFYVITA